MNVWIAEWIAGWDGINQTDRMDGDSRWIDGRTD